MYKTTGKTHAKPILWGAPGSAYSGKTRSYLIKKGIDYQEIFPPHPRYQEEILPLVGYFVMPVVELPDGTLIQDTTDTIVHFEQVHPEPALIPSSPFHKAMAWLLGFCGSELFLQTILHYRWSYLQEQRAYVESVFADILASQQDSGQQPEGGARQFDQTANFTATFAQITGALPSWGVTPDTIPIIEASMEDGLDILDVHFSQHPYLLGGRPSLADFGLMAPCFAHLSRDPHSSAVMKARAPHVFRWTERMNLAGCVDGGFPEVAPDYFPDDHIPDTLVAFLRYVFADCGPGMIGLLGSYNAWINAHSDLPTGSIIPNDSNVLVGHPSLGHYEFELRGVRFRRIEFVDAVYHFQRVLDVIADLEPTARSRFDALIEQTGGSTLMSMQPARRLAREYYRLVLV